MLKSINQWKIQQLLRMAELCNPEENERKLKYLNEVDRLMFGLVEVSDFQTEESEYAELIQESLRDGFPASEVAGKTCPVEVWEKVLEQPREEFNVAVAREIAREISHVPGWTRYPRNGGRSRIGSYGTQTTFIFHTEDA